MKTKTTTRRILNLIIITLLVTAFTASNTRAELRLDSVSPTLGTLGRDMEVTLTGTGFDENTKVLMMLDSGNERAIVGEWDNPTGRAYDVTIADGKAYMANGGRGLHVVDISDPFNPEIISTVDTDNYANSVTLSGGFALWRREENSKSSISVNSVIRPPQCHAAPLKS